MKYLTDNCTWLNVPYAKKDLAKALGARWDSLTKRWYCPMGGNLLELRNHGFVQGQSTERSDRLRKA